MMRKWEEFRMQCCDDDVCLSVAGGHTGSERTARTLTITHTHTCMCDRMLAKGGNCKFMLKWILQKSLSHVCHSYAFRELQMSTA